MAGEQLQELSAHEVHDVHDEHRQLRQLLRQIALLLDGRQASRAAVVRQLEDLQLRLVAHFEHEEQGGYFKEALEEAPRLSDRAAALLEEHGEFRRSLMQMRRIADAAEDDWRAEVISRFRNFATRLRRHEASETALLQEAYVRDIGAED